MENKNDPENIFPRIHPTEEEIEKCSHCRNAYLMCSECTPELSEFKSND